MSDQVGGGDNSIFPREQEKLSLKSPKQQMSDALKQRLKKCGRWHGPSMNRTPSPAKDTVNTGQTAAQPNLLSKNISAPLGVGSLPGAKVLNNAVTDRCEAGNSCVDVLARSCAQPQAKCSNDFLVEQCQSGGDDNLAPVTSVTEVTGDGVARVTEVTGDSHVPSSARKRKLPSTPSIVSPSVGQLSTTVCSSVSNVPLRPVGNDETVAMQACATPKLAKMKRKFKGFKSPRMKTVACSSGKSGNGKTENTELPEQSCESDSRSCSGRADCVLEENELNGVSKEHLIQTFKEKEETLRKLNMVKMYRSKNDLAQLQRLIDKWRGGAQQSVSQLCELLPEPQPSIKQLLDHLQVRYELIGYDTEEECFVE